MLPYDYSRCQNDRCPSRQSCLRWIDRNNPHARVFAVFEVVEDDFCDSFLDTKEYDGKLIKRIVSEISTLRKSKEGLGESDFAKRILADAKAEVKKRQSP